MVLLELAFAETRVMTVEVEVEPESGLESALSQTACVASIGSALE